MMAPSHREVSSQVSSQVSSLHDCTTADEGSQEATTCEVTSRKPRPHRARARGDERERPRTAWVALWAFTESAFSESAFTESAFTQSAFTESAFTESAFTERIH